MVFGLPHPLTVGLSGLSIMAPGGEDHAGGLDTEDFYEFLKSRGSGIITVPSNRWNAEAFHGTAPGKICTVSLVWSAVMAIPVDIRWRQTKGGFIPNFSCGDPQEFGITPTEASQMNSMQIVLFVNPLLNHRVFMWCKSIFQTSPSFQCPPKKWH